MTPFISTRSISWVISFAMIVATVLLVFSPIIKIGTGHVREVLLDRSTSGQSRISKWIGAFFNFLLDE